MGKAYRAKTRGRIIGGGASREICRGSGEVTTTSATRIRAMSRLGWCVKVLYVWRGANNFRMSSSVCMGRCAGVQGEEHNSNVGDE